MPVGIAIMALYPLAAAMIAKAIAVLPPVPSTMIDPGLRSPLLSASSTIHRAALSLMLPPGFRCSHFPKILQPVAAERDLISIKGVLPMAARIPVRSIF
jgi:hypothetical protein